MQWVHKCSSPPKKALTQSSTGKLKATIFGDIETMLLIEYMSKDTTINVVTMQG